MSSLQLNSWELTAVVGAVVAVGYLYRTRQSSLHPLPPGPPRKPLVGNLFNMPSAFGWKVWTEWAKTYDSSVLYLDAAGQSIIILNSYDDAKELLERRSAIYSSRPKSVMLTDLSGFGFQFGLMPYGDPWRARRRLFRKYFTPSNAIIHQLQEDKYVHQFLHGLLEHPNEVFSLLDHLTGAISISITYGIDIQPSNDPNLEISRLAGATILECLTAGSTLIDMIPALKYLPTWFPGASFHQVAAKARERVDKVRNGIFDNAYHKWLTRTTPMPSFISLCLDNRQNEGDIEELEVMKDTAGNVYMAASDSTSAVLQTFVLAMTCYPQVQKRAQEELDRVIGSGRLPTHADEEDLPYLSAILKECLRWQPALPAGVPHKTTAPDVYKGFYIPEGSTVIYNAWAILRDESEYPEPQKFIPERYLTVDGKLKPSSEILDPVNIAFGFGRRICPAVHIGLSVTWITAASLLTVFNIEKELDATGHPIEPTCEYVSGAVVHPLPFPCTFKPRSREAVRLVQHVMDASSG